ncbi:MAG: CYTH and CHAD domain-containing protein [Burkholderiaceae bacterium]|nr:CYTH and CHAD domain-containing protein [Burkholderiaceae bacterium]
MLERELKFYIPLDQRDGVAQAMQELRAVTVPLHACYFDTKQGDLAKDRIALRLRQEGQQWVQTIKAPGPDKITHIELNHLRPDATLDLSVYHNSAIAGAIFGLETELLMRYETVISRQVVTLNHQGSQIELAYDLGVIRSGDQQTQVSELEFEQLAGAVDDLFDLAMQWLHRHALVLDFRSKAERGNTLATRRSLHKSRKTHDIAATADINLTQAYLQSANECLAHIVANANLLAGSEGPVTANMAITYVHQLRVGIRRLRSCWRLFSPWIETIEKRPAPVLLDYFAVLGQDRDRDITHTVIAPKLVRAGMPAHTASHQGQDEDAGPSRAMAADPKLQSALLEVLHGLVSTAERPQEPDQPGISKLVKRLNKWLEHINTQGSEFTHLAENAQHDLRKKVKRLRYNLDFCAGLLEASSLTSISQALSKAQNTLGDLNDLYVAYQHYVPLTAEQPSAWFALGWLRAMQQQKSRQAHADFIVLAQAGRLKKRKHHN